MRGVTFTKGDPVVITSRVTGEEFHGEITVVKPKAVSAITFYCTSSVVQRSGREPGVSHPRFFRNHFCF